MPTCCVISQPQCFALNRRRRAVRSASMKPQERSYRPLPRQASWQSVRSPSCSLSALRRLTDVLLTLIPLLLAGVLTLEMCALGGLSRNFANIIALPLLLGVGVAFKLYYIMAWRAGKTGLLQSTLTRAVIFSAMTTAIAFGS